MTTSNNNANKETFMDLNRKSYATYASFAAVAAASGLALYGNRDVSSIAAGAVVGTAYAYLAGNLADNVSMFTGTAGKVAVGTLAAAGSFLTTAGVIDCVEGLKGKNEYNAVIEEALF